MVEDDFRCVFVGDGHLGNLLSERNRERNVRQEIRESGSLNWPLILGEAQTFCGLAVRCINHRARTKHRPIQLGYLDRRQIGPVQLVDWRYHGQVKRHDPLAGNIEHRRPTEQLELSICSERFGDPSTAPLTDNEVQRITVTRSGLIQGPARVWRYQLTKT